jgi:hypothetical protein
MSDSGSEGLSRSNPVWAFEGCLDKPKRLETVGQLCRKSLSGANRETPVRHEERRGGVCPASCGRLEERDTICPMNVGIPVRVHSRKGDDLGVAHLPPPVEVGDVLELGHGPMLPLRVVDRVETGPHSPLAALVKVSPAPMLVR